MTIELICTNSGKGRPLRLNEAVRVVAGAGIEGDRYYGTQQKYPGQNITLVEAEAIERFNAEQGTQLPLTGTRRNLITRGVRLNQLVGREFTIGSARLRGVELCEPCATLGRYLATPELTSAAIVAALIHKAGLRADVLTTGVIRVGDAVVEADGDG